ncbi:MAG: hypothetical protein K6F59_03175, partial [Gammaproteobacteria bacterium]|nr:hypothetical protein [Gammaproteobacteria bacterium]
QVSKSFLLLGILVTGLLSAIIGVLAFFGQNMGTFVISLDDDIYRTGIILSDSKEFKTTSPRLLVNPVNGATPIAYNDIKLDAIINNDGDYNDPEGFTYIAYTFYLLNEGNTIIDGQFVIDITSVTKGIDNCVRVMVVEDDVYKSIYKKADSNPKHTLDTTPDDICHNFLTDSQVCRSEFFNFRPGDYKKYSLVVWIEGWDADCDDSIKEGQLRMEMMFSIVRDIVVDEN